MTGDASGALRRGVARAAIASGVAETAARVLTIVLSIATARALLPSQVGVLGLAVIVVGIVSLIAACSETAGVVGRGESTDGQHALSATVIRAFIVAVLVPASYFCLPVITRLLAGAENAERELIGLIRILFWIPVLELVASYPRVLLQRKLDLAYLAGVGLFQTSLQVCLSVILLWEGYGAAGVAWSAVAASALSAILVWFRLIRSGESIWARLPDGKQRIEALIATSKVFAGSFVGYLNGRVDNLLVAGALGPTAMSFYGMAWSASRIAPQILGQAFGFVLVPALAKVQSDKERVGRALGESLRHSYLLLAPFAAVLFVSGPSLVTVVLGSKWLPIIPCMQVMSITILLGPLVSTSSALLIATGRAHVAGLGTAWQLAVLAALIVPLSRRWGVFGAAFGDLIAIAALTAALLAATPLVRKLLRQQVAASMLLPVGCAAISGLLAWAGSLPLENGLLKLLAQTGILLTIYPGMLSLVGGRRALLDLISLIRDPARRASVVSRVSPTQA